MTSTARHTSIHPEFNGRSKHIFRKEWTHERILGKNESYDRDFNIEPTWSIPFRVRHLSLSFEGFADYNPPKGNDSFGTRSSSEFLLRLQLKFDLSTLQRTESRILEAGIGLEYWHNIHGRPAYLPGAEQLTPLFTLTVHLPHGHQGFWIGQTRRAISL